MTSTSTSSTPPALRLLSPSEAAELIGVSPRTLENWRGRGHGPPHVRATKRSIRYRARDVERWISSQLRASTAAERPPVKVAS